MLTQGTSATVRSITDAVVIKDEGVYFLARRDGQVPLEDGHGFGLYFHDCRYVNGYELRLGDAQPNALVADDSAGFMVAYELVNHDLRTEDGRLLKKEQIGISWRRLLDAAQPALEEQIVVENFGKDEVRLPLTLVWRASFEDVAAVRGLMPERAGTLAAPAWRHGALTFGYVGRDDLRRSVVIRFSPAPDARRGPGVRFELRLRAQSRWILRVRLEICESARTPQPRVRSSGTSLQRLSGLLDRSVHEWLGRQTSVRTDSEVLNRVLARSLRDLRMLRSSMDRRLFFAAGVPWFVTLFGRDSLVAALQTLAWDATVAEDTLRLLAARQGLRVDKYRDEQPGRMLHEWRRGELARTGEIPHSPYYGTADATPLFLLLLGLQSEWTGSLVLFNELRENVDRALEWMDSWGDADGDGYIEYHSRSDKGLVNQGWKDSGDAIINRDGSLARPPIALVEVQAYAWAARMAMAALFRRAALVRRAEQLERQARRLQTMFNRDFWLPDRGYYALALEAGKEPCEVISSNPGHALWAGIAEARKANRVAQRIMADDMYNGWGIRTLAASERGYSPVSYHRGSVWPHDTAIIAAGLRRYGHDLASLRLFRSLVDAASWFGHGRLPELFAGFSRDSFRVPVAYPVACHPQAWSAGAIPYLLPVLLGLQPAGFDDELRVVRPLLPEGVDRLEVLGLRVGAGAADLRFIREGRRLVVDVLDVRGRLRVVVDHSGRPAP